MSLLQSTRSYVGAKWSRSRSYGSPLRNLRCVAVRVRHPLVSLRRRLLGRQRVENMPEEQRQRAAVMERVGCVPANPDLDQALLDEVCSVLQKRAQNTQIDTRVQEGKNFWRELLTDDDRRSDSIFLRFALQPAVLAMVSAYLGELPYLAAMNAHLSHGTDNLGWKASQLWHRDYDDRKMIKLFVYCSDVKDEKDGAFTFLSKEVSRHIPNTFYPQRITDEQMEKLGHLKKLQSVKGPAKTAFYIDTRGCYHLGSRVEKGHQRIALIINYVTHAAPQSFDNAVRIMHPLTETEQLLLRC